MPKIDDCQQETGKLKEYKGPGFESHFRANDFIWNNMKTDFLKQSLDQVQSKGRRQLTWAFDEKSVADYVSDLFERAGNGRQNIHIEWLPMPRKAKK